MRACGTCPTCIHSIAVNVMRDRTYPLIVPVYCGCPHAQWRHAGRVFLVRWGFA